MLNEKETKKNKRQGTENYTESEKTKKKEKKRKQDNK